MPYLTLTPSYGRDYSTAKAVREAWEAGKDFTINDMHHKDDGRQISKRDAEVGLVLNIRYKRLMQICQIKITKPYVAPPPEPTYDQVMTARLLAGEGAMSLGAVLAQKAGRA